MVGLAKLKKFLLNKIANLILKAIATKDFSNGSGFPYTNIDVLQDLQKTKVMYLRDYGFYSLPMEKAECIVVFPNGSLDEGIILKACHSEHEPKEQENGEVGVKHYKGHWIKMQEEQVEFIMANSKPLTIKAKNVNIELESGGQFSVAGSNLTVDA